MTPPAPVAAVVLAAGGGTRLGGPKALVEVAGRTLLEMVVATLRSAGLHRPVVVVGAAAERVVQRHGKLEVDWAVNASWATSHLRESLLVGRAFLPVDAGVLVWPVDCPHEESELVRGMLQAAQAAPSLAVVPVFAGAWGHPVIVPPELLDALARGPLSLRELLIADAARVVGVPSPADVVLRNINHPADLERLRRELARLGRR